MSRIGTIFWALVLGGSLLAMLLGFLGGRTLGGATTSALHPKPATIPSPPVVRTLDRALRGVHSLDEAEEDRDAYDAIGDAVAVRPTGWAPRAFDSRHDRPRVALIVIDAGVAGIPAQAFVDSSIPFAIVIPSGGSDGDIGFDARRNNKRIVIDVKDADPQKLALERKNGAIGIIAPGDGSPVPAKIVAMPHELAIDPLFSDRAVFYRAARARGALALTRDITVDGRDSGPYLDAMFVAAMGIARRTGVALIALHARPSSLQAAERFAVRARRNGIDIVPIEQLVTRSTNTATVARRFFTAASSLIGHNATALLPPRSSRRPKIALAWCRAICGTGH